MCRPSGDQQPSLPDITDETPIHMPHAGNTMESGTVTAWRIREGEWVEMGQVICEIETDKAVIEYESPLAGQVTRIVAAEGEAVPVKRPIAYVAGENAQSGILTEQDCGRARATSAQPSGSPRLAVSSPVEPSAPQSSMAVCIDSRRAAASPSVRRLARELNIDLANVERGSGPGGRIISTDLERIVAEMEANKTSVPTPVRTTQIADRRRRLSTKRRTIAARLLQSKQLIPHFYVKSNVRVDKLCSVHMQMKMRGCSLNDWIVLACGRVLAEHPSFRCQLAGDEIIPQDNCNVGIAVSLDDGPLVPVVKDVDRLSLFDLAAETKRVIAGARNGFVANSGRGCITVTNLGMYGVDEFAAIINPPESAILAVGAVRERVVVEDGYMRPGKLLTLTLSADHRLIDGVEAAKFLERLRFLLECSSQSWWQ